MTDHPGRAARPTSWPGLESLPDRAPHRGLGRGRPAPLPRRRRRLDVTVHVEPTGDRSAAADRVMLVHRPDEFFARLGRDGLIGFGEAYLTGAWDADDLAGFLTVLAAGCRTLVPEPLQRLRALVVRRHPRPTSSSTEATASQHRAPLRPVQRPLRAVPRRDAELLLRALRTRPARRRRPTAAGPRGRPGPQDRAAARPGAASAPAPGCSRSAPAGASSPSAPPGAARPSARSRSRSSSSRLADAADRRGRRSPTGSTVELLRLPATRTGRRTTPSCPSR